jgi:hypothetical protein
MFEALFMEQCSASRYKKEKVKSLDVIFWWAVVCLSLVLDEPALE